MKWTAQLPTKTGWYWHRHVIGSIPDISILHCIIMRRTVKIKGHYQYRYDARPSVYWRGNWIDVAEMPSGYRWSWSDRPIRPPKGEAPHAT